MSEGHEMAIYLAYDDLRYQAQAAVTQLTTVLDTIRELEISFDEWKAEQEAEEAG